MIPKFWQKSAASAASRRQMAHMTFAHTSVGRTISKTRVLLKRQLWLWPLLAIFLLSIIGFSVHRSIESTMKTSLESQLKTLLNVEIAMLKNWYEVQSSQAEAIANSSTLRKAVAELVSEQVTGKPLDLEVLQSTKRSIIQEVLPFLDAHDHNGFFIVDRNQKVLVGSTNTASDTSAANFSISQNAAFLRRAYEGDTVVTTPTAGTSLLKDEQGNLISDAPIMYALAPIRDENFQVIGALALCIEPDKEFTRIMQLGRMGESGETYALDRRGVMVSNSRFDHDLILAGLLADQPNSKSILHLSLRNPGGDMTRGYRPTQRRAELPMTKMAASATAGESGCDVTGYPDYRGVPVVGAWTWLPEFEIGIATEIDLAEAYCPLTVLSRVFWGLYGLLVFASIGIFVFTLIVNRMQREAQKAAIHAQELGQYKLESKLGAGAMGVVYKGYHAMMRRPTAIKLLNIDSMNDAAIARFEHEVQITSQLNHPNTIAIYDYGRTPEGVFYYAMEFLDGIDLQVLVDHYGPQPEARVINIMLQICGSLYEAHAQGLVHRDIKPANIMLNRRGGQPDVVKVLDFGLVKQADSASQETGLAGTPLYMSPEAIQSPTLVDACSDLYALGAVGYFLITGKSVFDATSVVELLQKHVTESPLPPSQRTSGQVSHDFEEVLLSCLEKARARRPQTARDLAQMLQRCQAAGKWTVMEAEAWWSNHERRHRSSNPTTVMSASTPTIPQYATQQATSGSWARAQSSTISENAKTSPATDRTDSSLHTNNSELAKAFEQTIWQSDKNP